jgi:hypothetical protein
MNKTLITVGMCLASLTFGHAVSPPTQQPQITADDLSWFSGIQYVKGSFDASDPQRPRTLRLILQQQGATDVVLLPELRIPHDDHWSQFPTEFIFISAKQPDEKLKLFLGVSNYSGRAHFSDLTDAFNHRTVVCVKYLENFKLTKGQHVLLYGDGGEGATDPKSQDFKVRIVLDAQ